MAQHSTTTQRGDGGHYITPHEAVWCCAHSFGYAICGKYPACCAVLCCAVYCRASRAGHVPAARLAAANASVLSAAARSFIRAAGPDPHTGWEKGSSSSSSGRAGGERMAALLCFDEMQVRWCGSAHRKPFDETAGYSCVCMASMLQYM